MVQYFLGSMVILLAGRLSQQDLLQDGKDGDVQHQEERDVRHMLSLTPNVIQ